MIITRNPLFVLLLITALSTYHIDEVQAMCAACKFFVLFNEVAVQMILDPSFFAVVKVHDGRQVNMTHHERTVVFEGWLASRIEDEQIDTFPKFQKLSHGVAALLDDKKVWQIVHRDRFVLCVYVTYSARSARWQGTTEAHLHCPLFFEAVF